MTLNSFYPRPLPQPLEGLTDLANDLRWNGSQKTDRVWELLDREIWERTENPYLILQNVSESRLQEAAQDTELIAELEATLEVRRRAQDEPSWWSQNNQNSELKSVAYFSMEFGLSEALPIYAGGLGILAGDHLKSASDLGVPVTGIGLLYDQGYFQQILTPDGWQIEAYPYNDPASLPISPVTGPNGSWLRVGVPLPGRELLLRIWQAQVGQVTLYLLDSNDPLNSPWDRAITSTLYGGGKELRLIQEIALGIGGWRLLEELGIDADICHLNEGHAAFVVLARARHIKETLGINFWEAMRTTRAGNLFTTHTPVPAGFDRFDPALVRRYLQPFADSVGVAIESILDLGRKTAGDPEELFNMAYLATRGSAHVNGVSQLHGQVSRGIFEPLYPRWPTPEVPVGAITNGVHTPSWDSRASEALWSSVCDTSKVADMGEYVALPTDQVSDQKLFEFRAAARQDLVAYVRRRFVRQLSAQGAPSDQIERAKNVLDPNVLTLGFARRFAAYKRPTLLLHDIERLKRILLNGERPVQLIVAGKAHPGDEGGKRLVQAMAQIATNPEFQGHIVFLSDYDIALTQQLATGVDVWINNPRRPMEACGTSGMKVLVNGGLNLSELDGWWAEAYKPEVGWALGDGQEHSEFEWDPHEADQLYEILEQQIVPEFYDRVQDNLPKIWLTRVRESMTQLTPQFSSHRMLREYVSRYYMPGATAYRRRVANGANLGIALENWHTKVTQGWPGLYLSDLCVIEEGENWNFEVRVIHGDLDPNTISVELYAEGQNGAEPERIKMAQDGEFYRAQVSRERSAQDYTPRIVPFHPNAFVPIESTQINWLER